VPAASPTPTRRPPPDRKEYPQYMTVERDGVNYDIPYKNDFT